MNKARNTPSPQFGYLKQQQQLICSSLRLALSATLPSAIPSKLPIFVHEEMPGYGQGQSGLCVSLASFRDTLKSRVVKLSMSSNTTGIMEEVYQIRKVAAPFQKSTPF